MTVVKHNNRKYREKATPEVPVLQEQAVDVLHQIPTEARYEDIVEELKGLYGDHQLTDKCTQKCAAAMDQMTRRASVG